MHCAFILVASFFTSIFNIWFLICLFLFCSCSMVIVCCGIHPAYSGMAALPYFDEIDPSTIDVLLVTQYVLFPC